MTRRLGSDGVSLFLSFQLNHHERFPCSSRKKVYVTLSADEAAFRREGHILRVELIK